MPDKLYGVPGFRGPELVLMTCPQCGKRRMYRSAGHVVSQVKEVSKDKSRKRYIDVCQACLRRYVREDQNLERRAKIAKQALKEGRNIEGQASIEDAL